MVEVGLGSLPVDVEGVCEDCELAVGVAGFDEVDRGGTPPVEGGIVRSLLRPCNAALTDCLRSSSVPIVADDGPRRCKVIAFQIARKSI